jgi:signal transduction histidine kinase
LYWIYRIQIAKAIAVERTRQKISKDLHDDVGSTLSSITLMNALLRKKIKSNPEDASLLAEKVEETSRDMIRNISDIVWSTNPENDTIDKMQFRLRQFAADVFEPKDITYKIIFDKEILKQELNVDVKHDLFLICKEIINNAAKYSAAKHFSISFSYSKNTIRIHAEDDGVGMDLTQKMRGNGLVNIPQRVKNQKGIAELISKPNEGTQWFIQIPI